jgi:hypothetical protein
MIGPAEVVISIAVILSAIISLIGTGARKQAVTEGRATATDLCELTGIFEPRVLQDLFGPPTMNGIYNVTLERIRKVRQPLGLLISEDRLDLACIAIALVSFFISYNLLDLLLMIAAAYQTAGWFISTKLPARK